jgi:hypothetical protein
VRLGGSLLITLLFTIPLSPSVVDLGKGSRGRFLQGSQHVHHFLFFLAPGEAQVYRTSCASPHDPKSHDQDSGGSRI